MTTSPLWWRAGPSAPPGRELLRPVPRALLDFHQQLPGYAPTPLVPLPHVATELRVGRVLAKDESDRFGLPAFKMLGASWASARAVGALAGASPDSVSPDALRRLIDESGVKVRLFTATAGNHGRAVARAARLLGVSARVWAPASTPPHLRAAIEAEDAELVVVPGSYDEAVRHACDAAADDGNAVLVQDTAKDESEKIPAWVVEGYATLFHEIHTELGRHPDVVVVPAGVGSLAQAAATYCDAALLTVEPTAAACLLASLRGGVPRPVLTGTTALAALNAGTVSGSAWPVLRARVAAAIAVTDDAALHGTGQLRLAGIHAGPCGGAALAGLTNALSVPAVRTALGIERDSCIVVLSTDGGPR